MSKATLFSRYSLVVCRNRLNQYLCVQERTGKWWIIGGRVEKGESFVEAALREAKEEASIDVELKGILAIDRVNFSGQALRTIYYAQPKDEQQQPKSLADNESLSAKFMTLQQITNLRSEWRAPQIYHYPQYLSNGGHYFPLQVFKQGPLIE